jgi:hypothetical protein
VKIPAIIASLSLSLSIAQAALEESLASPPEKKKLPPTQQPVRAGPLQPPTSSTTTEKGPAVQEGGDKPSPALGTFHS